MAEVMNTHLRDELQTRRRKLTQALDRAPDNSEVEGLLLKVDSALKRMEDGTYGLCAVCHDPVEADRLMADPLLEFCIDHLTPDQQRSLEQDLTLVAQVQKGLLPPDPFHADGWEVRYVYRPAGVASGDYCDLIPAAGGGFYFILGDVSGKGVAASMLMAHLHAMFRTLVSVGLPMGAMVEQASRVFCESTLPMHYATLVCGRADTGGAVEICNAGHLPVLAWMGGKASSFPSTGLPLGAFCSEHFSSLHIRLAPEDSLLLYTDGMTEAKNRSGDEYGRDRLTALLPKLGPMPPHDQLRNLVEEWEDFRSGTRPSDDLTLMAVRKVK